MAKFQKGHPKLPGAGMKKGQKIRRTLLREERRAIFDAEITQVFEEKIRAARAEYVLDQYLGKPTERHEVVVVTEPAPKVLEYINAITSSKQ